MPRYSELEALEKRDKIHRFWWNNVGAEGHISLPMLKKGIIDEFGYKDNRSILIQIKLMQVEMRIHIDMKFRVWIKELFTSLER
jgi:hypothetical protein